MAQSSNRDEENNVPQTLTYDVSTGKRIVRRTEGGLVDDRISELLFCGSCSKLIRTAEDVKGICPRCGSLLGRCCEDWRCEYHGDGRLYCRNHLVFLRWVDFKAYCPKHAAEMLCRYAKDGVPEWGRVQYNGDLLEEVGVRLIVDKTKEDCDEIQGTEQEILPAARASRSNETGLGTATEGT